MVALWSCGRRAASSKRSGKSIGLFVPAVTIGELVVRTMAEQPALAVDEWICMGERRHPHSVRALDDDFLAVVLPALAQRCAIQH